MGAVAADAVKMEAENKLMELTPMVVQEGVGALTNKASGVDWEDGRPDRLPRMTS